jgi:hypothetical protein
VQDAENSYLNLESIQEGAMHDLIGSSIAFRVAVGAHQGHKAFAVQRLPPKEEVDVSCTRLVKMAGFSLHADVAVCGDEREKLERLCRYITWPAVCTQCLSLNSHGNGWYPLKNRYRDGTIEVIFEPLDFTALRAPKEVPLGCIHVPAAFVHPCTSLRASMIR